MLLVNEKGKERWENLDSSQDRGFGSIFLSVPVVSENKMLFIPFPMAYIPLYVFREVIPVFKQVSSC